MKKQFVRGVRCGLPIGLGYFAVSFAFGITALGLGLSVWQATLISAATVTSAGQFAGVKIMPYPGQEISLLVSQLTINVRYSFMSLSLSQKTDKGFRGIYRWIYGFFMTDEIFAVASAEEEVSRSFFGGLCVLPHLGWTLGTLLGALLGSILPKVIMDALGLALYGMFVAIVVPVAKKEMPVLLIALIAMGLSCLFFYVPGLSQIPFGLSVSLCAILAAVLGAILFPRKEEAECH